MGTGLEGNTKETRTSGRGGSSCARLAQRSAGYGAPAPCSAPHPAAASSNDRGAAKQVGSRLLLPVTFCHLPAVVADGLVPVVLVPVPQGVRFLERGRDEPKRKAKP